MQDSLYSDRIKLLPSKLSMERSSVCVFGRGEVALPPSLVGRVSGKRASVLSLAELPSLEALGRRAGAATRVGAGSALGAR